MYLLQAVATTEPITSTTTPAAINIGQIFDNLNSVIAGFDFADPTWDLFIILFFLVSALIYGLTLGRERIILVLISIYIGLAVLRSSPFIDQLIPQDYGPNNVFVFKISLFIGVFVLIFFMLSRSSVLRTLAKSDAPASWLQVIVFSVLHVGLLISITLSFVPEEYHSQLSSFTREWFVGPQAEFFWIIAPIAAIALLGRGGDDSG